VPWYLVLNVCLSCFFIAVTFIPMAIFISDEWSNLIPFELSAWLIFFPYTKYFVINETLFSIFLTLACGI